MQTILSHAINVLKMKRLVNLEKASQTTSIDLTNWQLYKPLKTDSVTHSPLLENGVLTIEMARKTKINEMEND